MTQTHEIRTGALVRGSHGERLGKVHSVRTDDDTGEPTDFVVKTGIWPLSRLKLMSVDIVRQVNNDPDTIIVDVSRKDFRRSPSLSS